MLQQRHLGSLLAQFCWAVVAVSRCRLLPSLKNKRDEKSARKLLNKKLLSHHTLLPSLVRARITDTSQMYGAMLYGQNRRMFAWSSYLLHGNLTFYRMRSSFDKSFAFTSVRLQKQGMDVPGLLCVHVNLVVVTLHAARKRFVALYAHWLTASPAKGHVMYP